MHNLIAGESVTLCLSIGCPQPGTGFSALDGVQLECILCLLKSLSACSQVVYGLLASSWALKSYTSPHF